MPIITAEPTESQVESVQHHVIDLWHVAKILKADNCHAEGLTGDGIVVGIVDSGYYDHAFFEFMRKKSTLMYSRKAWNSPTLAFPPVLKPTGELLMPDPGLERSGHGTGMVANLQAIAPGARVRMYPVQSFMKSLEAALEQCQIISVSKATDPKGHPEVARRYGEVIREAEKAGKIICHASGNVGSAPWPIVNVPEPLIKVGGVYSNENDQLQAADYGMAHAGASRPDICGLCGLKPAGAYIWLPIDPDHDKTGWHLASGTSSATPQVAGICALMAEARARNNMSTLNAETARSLLRNSATPVTNGTSADGIAADDSWCLLANAEAAVKIAVQ